MTTSNLWVFGDSFADQQLKIKDQWMSTVAKDLNLELKCFGLGGANLEYTYLKFHEVRKNIQHNDIIIVTLTNLDRRWFFKEYPNFGPARSSPTNNKRENRAIEFFELYLNNPITYEINLVNFLYNLHYITEKLNLHTIVIANFEDIEHFIYKVMKDFPNFHFSRGNLFEVCTKEFEQGFFEVCVKHPDFRINHLIKSNHTVLAQKIIDNIKNNTVIDLKNDFHKEVINREKLRDYLFRDKEIFGINWTIPDL